MDDQKKWELIVSPASSGMRVDAFIAGSDAGLTRSFAQKLIEGGDIQINGAPAKKNSRIKTGDLVSVTLPDLKPPAAVAQDIPLDIVYEDESLIVINKPRGMVVHPAAGNEDGTLVNALLAHCGDSLSGIGGVARPGIVHRLDRDTSGLLVAAKTDEAHLGLSELIKAHDFTRIYQAVVRGRLKIPSGTVDAPIARHPVDRKRMAVVAGGKPSLTRYSVISEQGGYSHLKLKLETGRTHQIRVHLANLGHPVAGDPVYAPTDKKYAKIERDLGGQCLHASTLGFVHPVTGISLEFKADLPAYFTNFLKKISDPDDSD